MEKKKNNAVEKAEKMQKPKKKQTESKSKKISSAKEQKQIEKQNKKQAKQKLKAETKAKKQMLMEERQKIKAQKRIENAKIRAHRKAEKQKAKATRLREKKRKKQQKLEQRQKVLEQKRAKKEALKNETKKERQNRKNMERNAKREEKLRIKREKAQKRQQILADKKAKREEKKRQRQKDKGFGGWLAAVISLGVVSLVLASVLTYTLMVPSTTDTMLESSYQKSFYSTVEQVDNIDLNLSKILASKDKNAVQKYLVDTAINSELAENEIQQLPLKDQSKEYIAKMINQIGDYAKYLNNKLVDGEQLTAKDRENLENLYYANLDFKNALQKVMNNMGSNYSFSELENTKNKDVLLESLNELQNLSVQYPELIYDGPFSDGLDEREIKGLSNNTVSFEQAKENFVKIFNDYSFSKIESAGKTEGQIVCYNIEATFEGEKLYAQMSERDGKLIMFSYAGSCEKVVVDKDVAIENAQAFLENMGLTNMKEVWFNLSNNVYTINFAGEQNGVILYPDLVKVRVCAQTGKVIGIEAKTYYTNHTNRTIKNATVSLESAKNQVFDEIEIETSRLVIVPYGMSGEKLCYEFSGEYDGQTYYVYIDALTLHQVEMFKVIESTEGTLLM